MTENYDIIIEDGEIFADQWWDSTGATITVASGGTIGDTTLTHRVESLTLEGGANVTGTLTTAAPVTVGGELNAAEANIVWDISRYKLEEGLFWSDLGATGAASYSLMVSANQNKGTYRIAGNAADFAGSIRIISNGGVELGTLSLEAPVLDHDITRYTLEYNEAGELTVTVSSNITNDCYYVFLYKDNQLQVPLEEGFSITVSGDGEYENIVVIDGGIAGNIELLSGGLLTVYAGAMVVGVDQASGGRLRFDYTEGDSTVITGANQYGSFLVENNVLSNVVGEYVNLSGNLFVVDYHSYGVFTSVDGVDITGTFVENNSYAYFRNGTHIHDCTLTVNGSIYNSDLVFEKGITVTDSSINRGRFNGGDYYNVTVGTGNFYGGTFGESTWNGGCLYSYVSLDGNLTVNNTITRYLYGDGYLDAMGNTITLNFKKRKTTDVEILPGAYVSEGAKFILDLLVDQSIGTFQVLGAGDRCSKYSFTIRTAEGVLGTLTETNQSFEYGNYVYTMNSRKELVIDLSPDADETFNVIYWDAEDTFYHSVDLFGETVSGTDYKQVIVRKNGIAGDLILKSGGLLRVNTGGFAVGIDQQDNTGIQFDYTAGDDTLITGVNQYGTFFVQDDVLMNVIGEKVNLSGAISVQDYHSYGEFTATDGVNITGVFYSGKEAEFKNGTTIHNSALSGSNMYFGYDRKTKKVSEITVTDSTISSGNFYGGTYTNVTIGGGYLYGGTYADCVWKGGTLLYDSLASPRPSIELAGTLTLTGSIGAVSNSVINANGNTIVLDYTNRTVTSGAMISIKNVSEDVVFRIELKDDQNVGTYTIASNAGSFVDQFHISVGGDIVGTLNRENDFFEFGNYSYAMGWDNNTQQLKLTIDISENADPTFNVLCYNSAGELYHQEEMTTITVDGTDCAKVVVRKGGWLANTKLNNGLMTVRKGATVYGLDQAGGGKLRFDYAEGDNTLITGVNQYGTFFVENNELVNVAGENVNVSGAVKVSNYHSGGAFRAENGVVITDTFYGNGTFVNSTIEDAVVTGQGTVSGSDAYVYNSTFSRGTFNNGLFDTVTVNGGATLSGGTYREVTLAGGGDIRGQVSLDGRLIIGDTVTCVSSYSVNGAIDANGHEVNLDLTDRDTIDERFINLNRVYNADLTCTVYANQTIGTYTLGSDAKSIGAGDGKGYWDIETNKWLYKNAIQGDLDGVITIRSDQGVELARCTVNGATEYFGRYNYRVYTDEEDNLKLSIGWNNREDITFAPDGYVNDTFETATVLETASGGLDGLTIDSESDADYFKFTLNSTGRSSSFINITFDMWKGDLDMYLYDAQGNEIDYAKSVTNNEELSLHTLAAGDYYLKVVGDASVNEYELYWNLPDENSLVDVNEAGNDKAHSYHLGKLEESVSLDCAISDGADEDWFMFILNDDGTSMDSISIAFDDTEADLAFYIYGSNGKDLIGHGTKHRGHYYCSDRNCFHDEHHHERYGNDLNHGGSADGYTFDELYLAENEISLAGFKHGVYYVRVVSADGGATDYTLSANIYSGEVGPDRWENNNTQRNASHLYSLNGEQTIDGLSIHSDSDEDYFRFKIAEDGSADDYIAITHEAKLGDLDLEILDRDGNVVAYSRTAENTDKVSLNGLAAGEYYIRVYGYENTVNNYTLETYFTNSALIPADRFEGMDPVVISHSQTIDGLSLAKPVLEDETTADVYKIELEYDAWKSSKIILTDYRSDWDEGIVWKITGDAAGKEVISEGQSSEISLYGLKAGNYYLTVDAPEADEYSEYSLIAQHIPDSTTEIENTWSIFVYIAGDNNLEECFMTELLYMQHAILPEDVEVYVLMDRNEGYFVGERNWTDTRVGKIRHSPGGAVAVEWMYFDGVDTDTYMNTTNLELQQEWDTGDITTLEAFLDWGMQTGRADNYALIMKDHGTSLGYNCSDETSNSMLSITEISDLLSQNKYDDLSVVAFDQCLMGSDVVVSELEGVVDYTVASEAVGWTPNLLVMYKVLFNSLETNMTPLELSEKIVEACNCSGIKDLTLSAFDTGSATLSTALNEFAGNSLEFTYADWAAICASFGTAFNYGDNICAFSDLISILEETLTFKISSELEESVNTLLTKLKDEVILATQITPEAYGNGLAVFNPVLSDDLMSMYSYAPGCNLNYYEGTTIGQMAWGDFLYTVGALAEDVAEFVTADSGNLTFNNFYYLFGDEDKELVIDLGAFSGAGMALEGMYITDSTPAHFDIRLFQPGVEGDGIRIVSDDPEANVTITLVQYLINGFEIVPQVRRISENGFLSLEGVDFSSVNALSSYYFVVTSDKTTNYSMYYEADWATGVDRFDFARTGNIDPGRGGNNVLDKATKLAPGNYAGLMTYAGDKDYYRLNTVYANTIEVTVEGSGLIVQEYDANGNLLETAEYVDGVYKLTVAKDNYLLIEGNADISANEVNSYVIHASDTASTYLAATLRPLPEFSVTVNTEAPAQQLTFIAEADENSTVYYSQDLINWIAFNGENTATVTTNGVYYFKVKDSDGLESKYKSVLVSNIDTVAPDAPAVSADITAVTNRDVTVSATFSDDSVLKQYSLDNEVWHNYTEGVVFEKNGIIYFRSQDEAGNISAVTTYVVSNIDKESPVKPVASADITALTNQHVTVSATFSSDSVEKEYSLDNKTWWTYTGGIVFSANGTVYFRGQDEAGNWSEVTSYQVGNIDTTAPDAPAVSADITALTNQKVTVSATFSSDSVVKEYSFDGKSWNSYTAGIEFTANGTVYFRSQDEAGNWSDVTTYQVTNIDTIAPDAPAAAADKTAPTNQTVTVSATFSSDSVVNEYSIDGKVWNSYTAGIEFTANGTVYFRSQDEAGNWSEVTSYQVTNIDRIAPTRPSAVADKTAPTNQNVIVNATFDDSADVAVNQYSIDGIHWTAYPAQGVVMTEVGTVYFRSIDTAGNISEVFTCNVNNIDKIAPAAPTVSADITGSTNQEVTVTAVFPADSVTLQYKIGNGEWTTYRADNPDRVTLVNGKLVFTTASNNTVSFRSVDAAGNISASNSYSVVNIDTVAPLLNISGITAEPTNQNVTLRVTTSSDATLYYSLTGADGSWLAFDGNYEFSANGEIFFKAVDTAGNVTVSEKIVVSNIDKTAPVEPVVTASTTDPTNQNVILTAVYSVDSVLKQYSFNGSSWLTYDEAAGVTVSANGIVYFRAGDAAGNISAIVSKTVTNIDTVAPDAPTASADITAATNQKVTVSAVFSSDSVVKEYSLDGKVWNSYTAGIGFTANGTVYFRGQDSAGNRSEVTSYQVSNIDTVAPDAPVVAADRTTPTNQKVTVSATFSSDTVVKEYSLDGKSWNSYTAGIGFTANGTVYFRGKDQAGNWSEVTSYQVSNIDTVAPDAPAASADKTAPTNQKVTVSATFGNDSVLKQYSFGNDIWMTYTKGIVFSANGTVYFRSQDEAGNWSEVTSYQVSNIDTVAPDAPAVSADITAVTNQKVTVSAVFSSDSVVKEYSLDGKVWHSYTAGIEFTANGTVYFHSQDNAGNWSDVTSYQVGNIDTVAPGAPIGKLSTVNPTNEDVLVTVAFTRDSVVRQYKIGDGSWTDYTGAFAVSDNGTVYLRAADIAGNESFSELTVSNIDRIIPELPIITVDKTMPTNGKVTVSAAFSDDSVVVQYSTDNATWFNYYPEGVFMEENGTVYFRGQDEAGNWSEIAFYEVTNIDKIAPDAPAASADKTVPTNQKVTVSAVFSDDSVLKEYSLDGKVWNSYTAGIEFTANGTVYFRSKDEAGNYSDVTSYEVTNIDTVAPDAPAAAADKTTPTNQTVTVSATFSADTIVKEYSLDGKVWNSYTGGIGFTDNGAVHFRGQDEAGNWSDVTTYQVINIDKTLPVAPVASADITSVTNGKVTVSATFSSDSVVKEYSFDGKTWNAYTKGVAFFANGTVYFRGQDEAGNWSEATSFTVSNIDTEPPAKPVTAADKTAPTNEVVTVNATFSGDSILKEYSFDKENWFAYTDGIRFADNGTVYFRSKDQAGNYSTIASYHVTNIDKIAPVAPVASADKTAATNQTVTVSAVFSDDTAKKEYSLDNVNWRTYISGVVMQENGTVYFRGRDKAGNYSEVISYEVSNIYSVTSSENDDHTGAVDLETVTPENKIEFSDKVGAEDAADCYKFTINDAAKIFFDVKSTDLVKFTLFSVNENGTVKKISTHSVKANSSLLTKQALLTSGTYYIEISGNRKNGNADFSVVLDEQSVFYTKGDNSDDWTDVKSKGADGAVAKTIGNLTAETEIGNWVGFGDAVDYHEFTLADDTKLNLNISSTDAAKVVICKLNENKNGTFSLKTLQTTTIAAGYMLTTKDLLLENGTYYIGVTSTNAKRGGNADYTITVDESSKFFRKVDNSDDWTDVKTNGAAGAVGKIDGDFKIGTILSDWVGYGDAADYKSFTITEDMTVNFDVFASDAAKFNLYTLNENKNGTFSLKSLLSASVSAGQTVPTKSITLSAGTYYIGMTSTNAKKGGDADYTITVKDPNATVTPVIDNTDDWTDLKTKGINGKVSELGTLDENIKKTGWVGTDDAVDYMTFTLDNAASLSFDVSATDAAKFVVYELKESYNKKTGVTTFSLKALQTTTVKAGYTVPTKNLLLESGKTYAIGVTSTNAAKGGSAEYSFVLNDNTTFFTKADNSDDVFTDAEQINITSGVADRWVGYSDSVDYMEFTLDTAAKLNFDVASSDSAKFVIYQLNDKTGKLKTLQTTTIKADTVTPTKDLFLAAGTYYISVTSTNAKKGGNADYSFKLNDAAVFYPEAGDNSDDTWKLVQNSEAARLDGTDINGWVGYSDAADFVKLELDGSGAISLELDEVTATAYERKELKITCVDEKGKAIALTYDAATESFTSNLTFTEGTVCYVGVSTTDQKKYDTEYQITAGILA